MRNLTEMIILVPMDITLRNETSFQQNCVFFMVPWIFPLKYKRGVGIQRAFINYRLKNKYK